MPVSVRSTLCFNVVIGGEDVNGSITMGILHDSRMHVTWGKVNFSLASLIISATS